MKSPFVFGKAATGSHFINREEELKKLSVNLSAGSNTIVYAPGGWGKRSLVEKAAMQAAEKNQQLRVCLLDLFTVHTQEAFFEMLAEGLLKQTSPDRHDWLKYSNTLLQDVGPSFSTGPGPERDFRVKLELDHKTQSHPELLNFPENLARETGLRFLVSVGNIQKFGRFPGSAEWLKSLRSAWQNHPNVTYCLYGSRQPTVYEAFREKEMPSFRFGDTLYLRKIGDHEWIRHIQQGFEGEGKQISRDLITRMLELSTSHPSCMQQLAHHVFLNTIEKASEETLQAALKDIFLYLGPLYSREADSLSPLQLNFLKAMAKKEKALSSKEVVKKYNLGTAGNIVRIKKSLEQKEIVDFSGPKPEFTDPLFAFWLSQQP